VQTLTDEYAVRRLLAKFANSFDVKAWDDLGECLADSLYTDYSDLRGTPPESLSRVEFIGRRRAALEHLKTHHLVGNVEVYINGTSATARVSAMIFRRDQGGEVFNSHCLYLLGLQSRNQEWQICSIVQRVFWSEGNPSIHSGAVSGALERE
jgi:SnoaL-like domain